MSSDEKSGSQRAIKQPQVSPGPLADLKALLYQLYLEAGTPRLKQIAEWAAMAGQAGMPGPDTVARIVGSATMPPSQADLVTVATVLARAARWDPDDAARRARDLWLAARMASARTPAAGVRVSQADPRLLGVHSAISVPEVPNQVPPTYVPRDADDGQFGVRAKIAAAAERGGFVLLVGGSSVGKTRSAFEAVTALLPDWWLVHPAGHGEVAALATAPMPRTVVWMDELQLYLDGEHGLTGGVVRALLNAPDPVVIIATIWPDRYTACTGLPASGDADPHARERQVLELAEVIRIAPAFSPAEQERACAAAARDQRLAIALESAGYGLTQTLAAAPQLVARWEDAQTASPYAWAVLTAALDAARLGARLPLSADFLRAAAPGYCTSQQQAEAPDNWLEQALAYATGKLYGAAAALSPTGPGMGRVAGYTVADYLIQHASRERRYARVPASTWDAILNHISDPADTVRLADSAERRLLYRYAIPLYRHAADAGDGNAASAAAALLYGRGDLDGLRARAGAGDSHANSQLVNLFFMRGDVDELRTRADVGDSWAAERLAELLAGRGEVDGLRALADAGDGNASRRLVDLLAERGEVDGAEQILRALADAGDSRSAERLAELPVDLLFMRGDVDGLRALADAGDWHAAWRLVDLLAERGDVDELCARADAGDRVLAGRLPGLPAGRGCVARLRARADAGDSKAAAAWLAALLAERGDVDELRARADAGDSHAAAWLALYVDLDELRARADAGDSHAAGLLAALLVARGDLDELRTRVDAGDPCAANALVDALIKQGPGEEAERLRRFGLNPDGSIACA